jgi:hypothetical protein
MTKPKLKMNDINPDNIQIECPEGQNYLDGAPLKQGKTDKSVILIIQMQHSVNYNIALFWLLFHFSANFYSFELL